MAVFKYVAINNENITIKGSLEANSKKDVVKSLRERGYYPTELVQEGIGSKEIEINLFNKITLKDLSLFCRQFSFTLEAGTPMVRALELSIAQCHKKKLKEVLVRTKDHVQRGRSLADALRFEEDIPNLMVSMIEAGEASGRLEFVMKELAKYYEKQYKQKQKVSSATMYPKIVMIFAILIVMAMMTFVVPQFIENLKSAGAELPLTTKMLVFVSNILKKYWFILISIFGIYIAFKKLVLNKDSNYLKKASERSIRGPLFGSINRQLVAARFANTFAILNASGIGLISAIEISSKVLENPFIEERLNIAKEDIKKGNTIGKTIEDLNIFPLMLTQMITIGEETGTLDDILRKTSEYYDGEVEYATEKLVTLIEPLLIVGLAVIVLFIIASIMLPMFSMMDAIKVM
ncbi:type II secretion system F family protein [Clostridium baratii]|uniref:Type II secretory pathway, component PulF n=1 Tax=Clostridium baratii TaxID=1561 RepID=A0A174V5E0_9CLOT|nr:type II secretion system F family protein [Clostridium baratii]CUQ27260.1 type II secretory pathway%2C component PulF [Clostridium baratii]